MKYLSLKLLEKNLKKAEEPEFVTTVPKGFEEGFFMDFLKVLSMPDGTDDESISDEELVKMLEMGDKLFETLDLSTSVYESILSRLSVSNSHMAAFKRRIL